jgi:putative transposase
MRYVCIVRDKHSTVILAKKTVKHFTADILNEIVEKLIIQNIIEPNTLIFHSDHGCQYTSNIFMELLNKYGVTQSMSDKGCPNQNQPSEQVFSHMKRCIVNPKQIDEESQFDKKLNI